ncbi:MAG: FecR family protein [Bacteroidales bacterium]|nr:FecR family protein [Bacteroidales bacterium]
MKLMNKKYSEAIKESQRLSEKILNEFSNSSTFYKDSVLNDKEESILKEYSTNKQNRKDVNIDNAWIKLWLRFNSRYIYTVASAAVILFLISLLIFTPTNNNRLNNSFSFQEEIKPASGVVSLKLASGEVVSIDSISSMQASFFGVELDSVKQEISYNRVRDSVKALNVTSEGFKNSDQQEFNELTIPKGRSYSLVLSDGTRVWLNAQSSIRYPVSFVEGERRVKITGEAFFDVKHHNNNVFIVETEEYNIKVLGTKFNISSYLDQEVAAATLVSGSISISSNNSNEVEEVVVAPGEQYRYNKKNKSREIAKVDTELYTSWVDNNLRIKQMSLEDIFKILVRRYDIDLFYSDEGTKHEVFSGKIPLNDNLNVILEQISTVSKVEFQIEKKLIVVRYKD